MLKVRSICLMANWMWYMMEKELRLTYGFLTWISGWVVSQTKIRTIRGYVAAKELEKILCFWVELRSRFVRSSDRGAVGSWWFRMWGVGELRMWQVLDQVIHSYRHREGGYPREWYTVEEVGDKTKQQQNKTKSL